MRYYNLCVGRRTLSIVIGTLLVFLVFMGSAGALSETLVSDNVRNNYTDIASSNDIFPVPTAATGNVNITKIGHFGGSTHVVKISGNYAYTNRGSDFVVLEH